MFRLSVALVSLMCLGPLSKVSANPIIGSIGFNVNGSITPSSGSLNLAFDLTNIVTNNSASGDWVAFTNGVAVTSLMQFGTYPSVGNAMSFSDAGFGNFSGVVQFDSGSVGDTSFSLRQLVIEGTFVPGTTLTSQGFTSNVNGQLNLLIQSIGGGARSTSMVFGTSAVPEPTSIALVAVGFVAASVQWKRRRKHVTDLIGNRGKAEDAPSHFH